MADKFSVQRLNDRYAQPVERSELMFWNGTRWVPYHWADTETTDNKTYCNRAGCQCGLPPNKIHLLCRNCDENSFAIVTIGDKQDGMFGMCKEHLDAYLDYADERVRHFPWLEPKELVFL